MHMATGPSFRVTDRPADFRIVPLGDNRGTFLDLQ